jgi:hypothetical protein
MSARRFDALAWRDPEGDMLTDRFKEPVSWFAVAVVLNDQTGIDQFFEGVDHLAFKRSLAGYRLGGFKAEATDHDGQSCQHVLR